MRGNIKERRSEDEKGPSSRSSREKEAETNRISYREKNRHWVDGRPCVKRRRKPEPGGREPPQEKVDEI